MLKKLALVVILCFIFTIIITPFAYADTNVLLAEIKVLLDNKNIEFDVKPIVRDGRTLVPLRAIFEALGAKVEWEDKTKKITATKGDTVIVLHIDSINARVNDKAVTLEVPATIVNTRTLVPIRFISESMGVDVDWNNDEKSVILRTKPTPEVKLVEQFETGTFTVQALNAKNLELTYDQGLQKEIALKAENYDVRKSSFATYSIPILNIQMDSTGRKVTLSFKDPLDQAAEYMIKTSNLSTANSVKLLQHEAAYTMPVVERAKLLGVKALSSTTVEIAYDKPVDPISAGDVATYRLKEGTYFEGQETKFSVTKAEVNESLTKVILTIDNPMQVKEYMLFIYFVYDSSLYILDGATPTFNGIASTAVAPPAAPPTTAPTVPSEAGIKAISAEAISNNELKIRLDGSIDKASGENIANYTVKEKYGQRRTLSISSTDVDSTGTQITIYLSDSFIAASLYDVSINQFTTSSGSIVESKVLTFVGANPPPPPPPIEDPNSPPKVSMNISALSTAADTIEIVFSSAIDRATAENPSNYFIGYLGSDNTEAYSVNSIELDTSSTKATIKISGALKSGYLVKIKISNILDSSGNPTYVLTAICVGRF